MASGNNPTRVLAADKTGVQQAIAVLERGGLVVLPTETVYGLAARADSEDAVAGIYRAKGRPATNPLIVHVSDRQAASRYVEIDGVAASIMDAAWPGPLTLVLPRRADAPLARLATAQLPTVAVRSPAHPIMREVLQACPFPLAAPSANRSFAISPTTAEHVRATLDGAIDLVLDAGPCSQGLESTILAIRSDGQWDELRPGPVDLKALHRRMFGSKTGGPELRRATSSPAKTESPGQSLRHYAPGKPMRIDAARAHADEFHIGFGQVAGHISLSQQGDLAEAAARLFACLHRAAASQLPRIAVAPVPDHGLGAAINDRLRRAAA